MSYVPPGGAKGLPGAGGVIVNQTSTSGSAGFQYLMGKMTPSTTGSYTSGGGIGGTAGGSMLMDPVGHLLGLGMNQLLGKNKIKKFQMQHHLFSSYTQEQFRKSEERVKNLNMSGYAGGINAINPWYGGQLSSTVHTNAAARSGIVRSSLTNLYPGTYGLNSSRFMGQALNMQPGRMSNGMFGNSAYAALKAYGQDALRYSPIGITHRRYAYSAGSQTAPNKLLKRATTSNKGPGGKGKSSIYKPVESYSTVETELGQYQQIAPTGAVNAPPKARMDALHVRTTMPKTYKSRFSQIYKDLNTNVGYARREMRTYL